MEYFESKRNCSSRTGNHEDFNHFSYLSIEYKYMPEKYSIITNMVLGTYLFCSARKVFAIIGSRDPSLQIYIFPCITISH